jgi:CheY-like chemotaxis protein
MDTTEAGGRDRELSKLYHALMNPLTVVLGYAQLLSSRKDLDQDVRAQVTRILEEARECSRIIERARASSPRSASPASPSGPQAGGAPRRRVLVIDDEPVIQKLTAEALGADSDVVGVSTGAEAAQRLLAEDFDVVLLDLSLGGEISGRALYETLTVQQSDVAERVVFVTGGIQDAEVQEFVTRSGREFLQKPFHLRTLRDVVARVGEM